MAQSVVSCSSCGKKFRVPDGAGDFECTGCGELVPVGGARPGRARASGRAGRRGAPARRGESNNNTAVIAVAAVACVAVVVVILFLVMGGDDGPGDRPSNRPPLAENPPPDEGPDDDNGTGGPTAGNSGTRPDPMEDDTSSGGSGRVTPEPEPEPERTRPEPEPAPREEEDDYYTMQWPEISEHMKKLEHVESTSAADRAKIDKKVELVMDFQSGRDGTDAMYDLVDIGKPAVPMLLKAVGKLSFTTIEDRAAAALVDEALRKITNYTRQMELKAFIEDPRLYKRTFKYHFVWWKEHEHLEGDKFREQSREPVDDEEEEGD